VLTGIGRIDRPQNHPAHPHACIENGGPTVLTRRDLHRARPSQGSICRSASRRSYRIFGVRREYAPTSCGRWPVQTIVK